MIEEMYNSLSNGGREIPCNNCVLFAVCINKVKEVWEIYKENECINKQNEFFSREDYEAYYNSVITVLYRCDIFKEYFPRNPGTVIVEYDTYNEQHLCEYDWMVRTYEIYDKYGVEHPMYKYMYE